MTQDRDGAGKEARASREDAVVGLVVVGVAAVIFVGAFQIPGSSYSNAVLSPRDFPLLIGVLMAVAGAALFLRNAGALRRSDVVTSGRGESDRPAPPVRSDDEQPPMEIPQSRMKLALLLLLLLGYIRVFLLLGYNISTFLFLAIGSMLLAPRHPVRNLTFAAGLTACIYLLFTNLLNVVLPPGPLGGAL